MSRVLIGNLPPGTTIRNIDDFCSPYGRLLYVDIKSQGNAMLACVEYENLRNALNLVRDRQGYNFNGYNVQLKLLDDSGPCEVRDDTRQQSQLPAWSNNQMFNSGMQGSSTYNYGGNNLGGNDCGLPSLDNSLDFNDACRIVFDRFLQEGYNRQVAKEKTLEFVTNMQRGSSQGFNNLNSYYFGSDQDMMNPNSSFGNFNNGNQNWSSGNNYDNGYQQSFSNSNRGGNFNGPSDRQMPSAWGGGTGLNGGGMSYQKGGDNFSGRSARGGYRDDKPSSSGRNIGGSRKDSVTANAKTGSNVIGGSGFQYERYVESLGYRKKIEARIKSGNKSVRDLKNLQFHNKIIKDYEYSVRQHKKPEKKAPINEEVKLQRYNSALGIVRKYKKVNQSLLSLEQKNNYISNKAIVDEYEKYAKYERKKKELIKQSKLNHPHDFRLSRLAKKKMRALREAGLDAYEAKLLAVHASNVIQELFELKSSIPKSVDKTKQLVPVKSAGGQQKNATSSEKSKQLGAKPSGDPLPSLNDIIAKKLKAGYRAANKVLQKHENSDLAKLTEKEKAIIRISLRRLRSYNLTEGKETPTTRFDVLLTENTTDKTPAKKENTEVVSQAEDNKEDEEENSANVEEDAVEEVDDGGENEDQDVEEVEAVEGDEEGVDEEFVEGDEEEQMAEEEQVDEEEQMVEEEQVDEEEQMVEEEQDEEEL